MSTVVLIPAHDEANVIGDTLAGVHAAGVADRIIVIDDGSSDGTSAIAEASGAETIRLERNLGKGAALTRGLARAKDAEIVVFLDADLGPTAVQCGSLVRPVADHLADMTVAAFPPPSRPGGFGLVKGLARTGISRLSGFSPIAPLSGQRALSRRALDAVLPLPSGYGVEVTLTVRAARAGFHILEVPTTMAHDATGRDVAGFAHRGRQFLAVAAALVRLALRG